MNEGKILVVEDEAVPRRLLVLSLERIGFDVVACEDGPSALETAFNEPFDAAVLDIRLPKKCMDGMYLPGCGKTPAPPISRCWW